MFAIARTAALLFAAALCFVAAVFAGVRGAEARTAEADGARGVCCIYMIF